MTRMILAAGRWRSVRYYDGFYWWKVGDLLAGVNETAWLSRLSDGIATEFNRRPAA